MLYSNALVRATNHPHVICGSGSGGACVSFFFASFFAVFFLRKAKINMSRLWSGAHVENMGCEELFWAFQVHR